MSQQLIAWKIAHKSRVCKPISDTTVLCESVESIGDLCAQVTFVRRLPHQERKWPNLHRLALLTARNAYDLLPTIRSRAVPFYFSRLSEAEMQAFLATRQVDEAERRLKLAEGSPGLAVSLDLESFDRRRAAMLVLLKVAGRLEPFGAWMKHSDSIAARRTEKLESYLEVLYSLIGDVLRAAAGSTDLRNADLGSDIQALAHKVSFGWLRAMTARVDELVELGRRNIQKSLALDALAVELRTR